MPSPTTQVSFGGRWFQKKHTQREERKKIFVARFYLPITHVHPHGRWRQLDVKHGMVESVDPALEGLFQKAQHIRVQIGRDLRSCIGRIKALNSNHIQAQEENDTRPGDECRLHGGWLADESGLVFRSLDAYRARSVIVQSGDPLLSTV